MNACALACVVLMAGPGQVIGTGPASVGLVQTQHGYAVTFRNHLVRSLTVEPFALDLGGFAVTGRIVAQGGDLPDLMQVDPPAGWWCDPCGVVVDEDRAGTVELWPEVSA